MKKKIILIGIIILIIIYIIFYGATHHFFYGSICGSGLNGLKLLVMYYIPLSLLLLLTYILFKQNRTSTKRCEYCRTHINRDLDICPYCGNHSEGNAEGL
ncbi:hypothetical protein [Sporosalibacterium faouarense]|uniref:hypothetical protein n=1 Tax=Sporosalibacterium faouarense TaxID=516123 RepID=UPI00192CAC9B|nr:hypothetical protein [Sporosalibacterium faouarense]